MEKIGFMNLPFGVVFVSFYGVADMADMAVVLTTWSHRADVYHLLKNMADTNDVIRQLETSVNMCTFYWL